MSTIPIYFEERVMTETKAEAQSSVSEFSYKQEDKNKFAAVQVAETAALRMLMDTHN